MDTQKKSSGWRREASAIPEVRRKVRKGKLFCIVSFLAFFFFAHGQSECILTLKTLEGVWDSDIIYEPARWIFDGNGKLEIYVLSMTGQWTLKEKAEYRIEDTEHFEVLAEGQLRGWHTMQVKKFDCTYNLVARDVEYGLDDPRARDIVMFRPKRGPFVSQITADGKISMNIRRDIITPLGPNRNTQFERFSVYGPYIDDDTVWLPSPISIEGHHYLILNSLGKHGLKPTALMGKVNENPSTIFGFMSAFGRYGQKINVGNVYNLTDWYVPTDNFVRVTDSQASFFTFTAGDHTLKGFATHGIVEDAGGELWLFQEGFGSAGEEGYRQLFNYWIAHGMWGRMADNIKGEFLETTN